MAPVAVDVGGSGREHVVLEAVNRSAAGSYMCKVTVDRPTLKSVAVVRILTVKDAEGKVYSAGCSWIRQQCAVMVLTMTLAAVALL